MFKIISLFSLYFFISSVFANSPSYVLNKKLNKFYNITANFHQVIKDSKGNVLQESFGKMAIERPNRFKWDVKKDIEQLIISDGDKVWIYDPDLNQVVVREFDEKIYDSAVIILTNPNIQNNFSVILLSSENGIEKFKLTPVKQNSLFDSIIVLFNKDKIISMRLINKLDQTTELNFSNISCNSFLDKKLFSFSVPKDVDVIFE